MAKQKSLGSKNVGPTRPCISLTVQIRPHSDDLLVMAIIEFVSWNLRAINPESFEDYSIQADILERLKKGGKKWRTVGQELQQQLISDLTSITVPKTIPYGHALRFFDDSQLLYNIDQLLEKLNKMKLKSQLGITTLVGDGTSRDRKAFPIDRRALLEFQNSSLGSTNYAVSEWIEHNSPASHLLYWMLRTILISGAYSTIKSCRWCQKLFIGKDPRRVFCRGTNCKDQYYNKVRAETDYFRETRAKKRQQRINQAKKLLQANESLSQVSRKIPLPRQVLERLLDD